MARFAPFLVLAALAGTAVAVAPAAAQDKAEKEQEDKKPKPKRNPDVISLEEIDAIRDQVGSAQEIVQRLRPTFLRTRGGTTLSPGGTRGAGSAGNPVPTPKVILDGTFHGEVESLRQIVAISVKEIRYLSASNATTKYGTDFGGGAILVTTR